MPEESKIHLKRLDMGAAPLSIILLTLFASSSLADFCVGSQADLEAAEAAREQADIEFEAARLAYGQAQVSTAFAASAMIYE